MTSIRNFAFAALLAATLVSVTPNLAQAQEPARGHFTLRHDVRWGNAKVPAGEYEFSFDTNGISPVLSLTKLNGARAGFMVLVPSTDTAKSTDSSKLVLEATAEGSYVSAMQLPDFGMTLHFNVPAHATEKQLAKATTIASASGQ